MKNWEFKNEKYNGLVISGNTNMEVLSKDVMLNLFQHPHKHQRDAECSPINTEINSA